MTRSDVRPVVMGGRRLPVPARSPRLRALVAAGFRTTPPSAAAELNQSLWNEDFPASRYSDAYLAALLDQYKLYVEMADRVSARRGLANTFFITLNSAILTAFAAFSNGGLAVPVVGLVLGLVITLGLCLAWFWLVRSYRQLNSGKFAVVGALERRLPASPFWAAEWAALGSGRDKSRYWPITHLEQWVPALFALGYTTAFLMAIAAH